VWYGVVLDSEGEPARLEGVSLRGVGGDETTFASMAWALVGLDAEPAESRRGRETSVVRHGEETVDGVRGGRRLPDLDRCGASVGSE
jgi:hypothetical protein